MPSEAFVKFKKPPARAKSGTKPPRAPKAAAPPAGKAPAGKIGIILGLLRRTEGASLSEMMQATGWQAHSVRGALSGAIKKRLGLNVSSTKTETGRTYRVEAADDAA